MPEGADRLFRWENSDYNGYRVPGGKPNVNENGGLFSRQLTAIVFQAERIESLGEFPGKKEAQGISGSKTP